MDEHDHELPETDTAVPPPRKIAKVGNHESHRDRRTERLEDLTTEALKDPDALRATVKAATAQLLDIGYRMGDEIKATVGSHPARSKSHQDGMGAINALMLVHRQITRYVQLDQQWASEKTRDKEPGMHSAESNEVE